MDSERELSIESASDGENLAGFEPVSRELNYNKTKGKMSMEIRPFVCNVCQRGYKTKGSLKIHIERHQKKSGQFDCSRCRLRFLIHPHYKSHACI